MRPLLVGELNPYGIDPQWALYPLPENASGGRLRKILQMSIPQYIGTFDRKNLCYGKWSNPEARAEARVIQASKDHEIIILLGSKVCQAFGVQYKPFERLGRYLVLPHPSGRCLAWNDPTSAERARRLVQDALEGKNDGYQADPGGG